MVTCILCGAEYDDKFFETKGKCIDCHLSGEETPNNVLEYVKDENNKIDNYEYGEVD